MSKVINFIKEILKYILIFCITVTILVTILTLVAKIPRKHVETNLKEAAIYFKEHNQYIEKTKRNREYTYGFPWDDEVILNIIYCLDTENPLESVLEAKYYTRFEGDGAIAKYRKLIEIDGEGNQEYMRYWHGSIAIIKPLLIFFTLDQILILLAVIMIILIAINMFLLVKKKYYSIAISFLIGLILIAIWYVPNTFSYMWTFLIMLVTMLISILIEEQNKENKNKKLYSLFLVTGIITCFLDFLITEIITILVPLVVVISMRMKNNNFEGLRKEVGFAIKAMIIWFAAYSLMWVAKWVIASYVLGINAMDYVTDKAMIRVNGQILDYTKEQMKWWAFRDNFTALYPINIIKRKALYLNTIPVLTFIVLILAIDKKDKKKLKYLLIMSIIAIVPYLRYLVLYSHSFSHAFFTFRSQLPTVMSIILILANCSNREKLFGEIKKKKEK